MAETVKVNLVVDYHFSPREDARWRDVKTRQRIADLAATLPPTCGKCGERIPDAEPSGIAVKVQSYDEVRREMSANLIAATVASVYKDDMPKDARRFWRRIQEQLYTETLVLDVDGTSYKWLVDTLTNDKAKVHPSNVSHFETLLESLPKPELAPAAEG